MTDLEQSQLKSRCEVSVRVKGSFRDRVKVELEFESKFWLRKRINRIKALSFIPDQHGAKSVKVAVRVVMHYKVKDF